MATIRARGTRKCCTLRFLGRESVGDVDREGGWSSGSGDVVGGEEKRTTDAEEEVVDGGGRRSRGRGMRWNSSSEAQ